MNWANVINGPVPVLVGSVYLSVREAYLRWVVH